MDPVSAPKTNEGGWEKVDPGMMVQPGESIPASTLVGAAYGFIWLMVLFFVVSAWRRAGRLEREIDELKIRLERRAER